MRDSLWIGDLLRRAHGGGAWHGPSVRYALRGVDYQMAALRPPAGVHTIWEIVHHLTAWNRAVALRARGRRVRLSREQDWPRMPSPSARAWAYSLDDLDSSHKELARTVRGLSQRALSGRTGSSPRDTVFENLLGTVQHYTYHAGQIMLLKKIARNRSR